MTNRPTPIYPRLVGDVGGTHARFALVQAAGDAPDQVQILATEKFPTLLDAIKHYLEGCPQTPRHACLGIATPLQGDWVEMTNHPWAFSAQQLAQDLRLQRLLLLNDFTALALGVPSLSEGQLRQVGGGTQRLGAKAVLGPCTGLGTSALVPLGDQYLAVPGEGGHVTLPAATAEEAAVIDWLWRQWPHVSAERLLSGPGLVLLHRALAHVRGVQPQVCSAPEITARALQGQDQHCHDTVSMFCAMLGTVASNLALTLGAVGGVYIGGGIVPALGDYFHCSPFRARFENKGRYSSYLADIPSYIIHAPLVALVGANAALDAKVPVGGIDVRP